jgi:hypothetical protein
MLPAALLCGYVWVLAVPLLLRGGRLNLPLWYFVLVGGVLATALTGVLRRWPWGVRLTLHAAWLALLAVQRLFEYR